MYSLHTSGFECRSISCKQDPTIINNIFLSASPTTHHACNQLTHPVGILRYVARYIAYYRSAINNPARARLPARDLAKNVNKNGVVFRDCSRGATGADGSNTVTVYLQSIQYRTKVRGGRGGGPENHENAQGHSC